jgi:predicted MFS family arabinose efflux permease
LTIVLISTLGWRDAWRITGAAALLILVPATLWLLRSHRARHQRYLDALYAQSNGGDDATARPRRQWTRGEVLRDRRFYMAMPACLAPSFFFTGFFFHQVHLVEVKGWDLNWWGSWFAAYAFASLLATTITGPLVDKLGAVRLMPLFPMPMALALLTLSSSDTPMIAIAFLLLNGITAGWSVTVMGPLWAEVYGVLHLGAIKALGSALSVFSSALSPFLLGWLIDKGASIDTLALGSAVYVMLACALAFFAFRARTG